MIEVNRKQRKITLRDLLHFRAGILQHDKAPVRNKIGADNRPFKFNWVNVFSPSDGSDSLVRRCILHLVFEDLKLDLHVPSSCFLHID